MAYTSEQVTALEEAIATGALEVQYTDKRVKYRSIDDMIKVLNLMKRELGLNDSSKCRKTAVTGKGL
jgi:hypothetical protein